MKYGQFFLKKQLVPFLNMNKNPKSWQSIYFSILVENNFVLLAYHIPDSGITKFLNFHHWAPNIVDFLIMLPTPLLSMELNALSCTNICFSILVEKNLGLPAFLIPDPGITNFLHWGQNLFNILKHEIQPWILSGIPFSILVEKNLASWHPLSLNPASGIYFAGGQIRSILKNSNQHNFKVWNSTQIVVPASVLYLGWKKIWPLGLSHPWSWHQEFSSVGPNMLGLKKKTYHI